MVPLAEALKARLQFATLLFSSAVETSVMLWMVAASSAWVLEWGDESGALSLLTMGGE